VGDPGGNVSLTFAAAQELGNLAAVHAAAQQVGANTVITYDNADTITLIGVSESQPHSMQIILCWYRCS
jgi:hypothetical protein